MFYVRNLFNTRKKDIWAVLIFEIFSMILIHFLLKVSNWGHFRWLPCPSTMTFSIITLCERFLCPKDIFYLPRVLLNQNYFAFIHFKMDFSPFLPELKKKHSTAINQLLFEYSRSTFTSYLCDPFSFLPMHKSLVRFCQQCKYLFRGFCF